MALQIEKEKSFQESKRVEIELFRKEKEIRLEEIKLEQKKYDLEILKLSK